MSNGYKDLPVFGSSGGGSGGSGTVTSVDLAVPTGFTVSGNPITTSGTITIGLSSETQSTFWAASSTTDSAPSFRRITSDDIAGLGGGTVTSVGVNLPPIFSTSGSPVTTTGTIGAILVNQAANRVFASPSGSTGSPTFRALVSLDVPAASLASSGNGGVTGVLPVVNGGTSLATLTSGSVVLGAGASAPTFVAPGSSGTVLISNGTVWQSSTVPVSTQFTANLATTGSGGVTGTLPNANVAPINLASASNGGVSGTLAVGNGGTGSSTGTLSGSVVLGNNASPFSSLAPGSSGTFVGSNGTTWAARSIPVQAFTQAAANLPSSGNGGVTGVLPIENGGTNASVAATAFNNLSPLTTKGDLLTFTTTNARLGVGTQWQYLLASSATASGLVWSEPKAVVVKVSLASPQSIPPSSSVRIAYDTVDIDTFGLWDSVNKRFNAYKTGYYQVTACTEFNTAAGGQGQYGVFANGALWATLGNNTLVTVPPQIGGGTIVRIGSTGFIEIFAAQTSVGSVSIAPSGTLYTHASISYIGS